MVRTVSNSDDVIDSRDVIERINELEESLTAEWESAVGESDESRTYDEWLESTADDDNSDLQDDARELLVLKELADDAEGYTDDWKYGATLIRESYFVNYCEELVKDIGDMPKEIPHYIEIDWEATANNIRVDYTEVEFDGVTYLVR